MRKRTWLVVLFLVGILVVTLGATPIFAHGSAVADDEAWEEMHQACENGDYEAMAELHAQYHGGEGSMNGDMMGGGMMGGGMVSGGMVGGGMIGGW